PSVRTAKPAPAAAASPAADEKPAGRAEAKHAASGEVSPEGDLPLAQQGAPGSKYTGWEEAVSAYGAIKPGVAAMLDHVVCAHFGDKVRLGLDTHQQRAISHPDRMAFAEWLGREVFWESKDEHQGETLSQVRTQRAEAEEARLRHQAESDPHVQALIQELDAKLMHVRPAGAQGEDSDAAEAEQG
ncbi:MAG TPA: DNA polymerase III subunit gamma/tau, partial [Mariprofundaceae bacterium]|nr:DNA polymerase III subunit gamma/tau [Mariprofundaceae bacterium]